MVKIIPILLGMAIPCLVTVAANALRATAVGTSGSVIPLMDFSTVAAAAPIGLQPFFTDFIGLIAGFDITFILVIVPIAVVAMIEYIGDMSVISATVGGNSLECPSLHRTLIGDGIATPLAGLPGGSANIIYGKNTGVLMLSRVYDPKVVRLAVVYAAVLFFPPVFIALVNSIPTAIVGGMSFILYGVISVIGVRNVVENQVDLANSHNLIIAAVILACGLGFSSGITFPVSGAHVTPTNLAIAAIAGIALNAIPLDKDHEFGSDVTEGHSGDLSRYWS